MPRVLARLTLVAVLVVPRGPRHQHLLFFKACAVDIGEALASRVVSQLGHDAAIAQDEDGATLRRAV